MVERYNAVGYDPGMTAAHGGSWVRYSDYARLQGQVETLTKERDCDPDGCKAHIDAFMARAEATEAERDRLREAIEFIARWAWRTDPPNANNNLTDRERLSAIKYYPVIKKAAAPHIELAEREAAALQKEPRP